MDDDDFALRRTRSVEDFLKAVYLLQQGETVVTTKALAAALDITPPSVNDMIKRLTGGKNASPTGEALLEHLPYQGVRLSAAGERVALQVIRRHRLLELYLVERLGYTWDEVHDEAERLEHAMSPLLEARIAQALGNPEFDPHGDPIPSPEGVLTSRHLVSLLQLMPARPATILRIADQSEDSLRYLAQLGLTIGQAVRVLRHALPNDTIVITVAEDSEAQTISTGLASKIWVQAD
jgi:DtxR family Mn-dependent transcriptional regulator